MSDYVEIPLTKGYVAKVSPEDAHLVAAHRWRANETPSGVVYAQSHTGGMLHRFVLGVTDPAVLVDHRDGDGLNCVRRNLLEGGQVENQRNVAARRRNSTLPMGVSPKRGGYEARIRVSGRRLFLGTHPTVEAATVARLVAERQHWGIQPRRLPLFQEYGLA